MGLIVGRKPVLEAINSGEEIEQVYILYGQRGGIVDAIRIAARKRGIKINQVTPEKFKALSSHPNTQGIIARKSSHKYFDLEEIISSAKKKTLVGERTSEALIINSWLSEVRVQFSNPPRNAFML